ncbi:sacsin N-terminal ATP-binding-like domain-containing protein [Treponema primitia]|uniref:sacsin N-terminal ATP-binding-like domain-containing protein n=1 Tax=Treponema primitia TaxID=88058 RepID=UPI00025553A9|nr:DUF3883 domain-containing protein [Treponema primitia]
MIIADTIRDRYIREYTQEKFRLESDFKEDEQRRTDYHGRELLELLQNVDDAAVKADIQNADVLLEYKNNIFTVANNGTQFTAETIERLCHGAASNKTDDFIGNKGTGFRSLLNWGRQIEIHSGEFHIGFSQNYANSEFEKILSGCAILQEQKKNVPNLSMPVLHCPFEVNSLNNKYDTTIQIITDDSLQNDEQNILKQLQRFDHKTLLFLPNIMQIIIKTDEYTKIIRKAPKENEEIEIYVDETIEKYLYFKNPDEPQIDTGKNEKRKIRTAIAIALDEWDYSDETMYCFFPIRSFSTPLNMLMHATFELNANRDDIPPNETNRSVFEHLLKFAVSIAENTLTHKGDNLLAIKTLTPSNMKNSLWDSSRFNRFDFYLKLLKNCKFIPTVNDDFVSMSNEPKLIASNFPDSFTGKYFANLLKQMPSQENGELLRQLAKYHGIDLEYKEDELSTMISEAQKQWSISERVEAFIWWCKEYKSDILPNLMLNQKKKYVKVNESIYFVGRKRELNIPDWTKVNQLNRSYEIELIKQLKENSIIKKELNEEPKSKIERIIQRHSGSQYNSLIPQVKFLDTDASQIISPINTSVGDDNTNSVKFVVWLWENYSKKLDWTPPPDVRFNLPSKKGTVERSSSLYFDNDYDNQLGDKLFIGGEFAAFPNIKTFSISENEKFDFQNFIIKLGVKKFPELVMREVKNQKFRSYFTDEVLAEKLPGNENKERVSELNNIEFNTINRLEKILEDLSLREIIAWIKSDSELQDELDLKHSGSVNFKYIAKIESYRSRNYTDYQHSYIKFIFENTKWFEINKQKYSPNQCVYAYPGINISGVVPTVTNQQIKDLANQLNITQKELKDFLTKIGVKDKITDLESRYFYEVLLKLPEHDQSGQISEKIYREIIDFENNPFDESDNKAKFVNLGQVFTKNHSGKGYHIVSDSYFSNSIQVNVGNYHIMETPSRKARFEIFNSIFGVKKFEEKYEVIQSSIQTHPENNKFQADFRDFKIYVKPWGEKNVRLKERLDNLKVQIVSNITLTDGGTQQDISTDYTPIKGKAQWFIYLHHSSSFDQWKNSECMKEIIAQVANTPNNEFLNQIRELYRTPEKRSDIVRETFGIVNVINEISKNQIRVELAEALNIDYESIELIDIDFINFNSIDNSESLIKLLNSHNSNIKTITSAGFGYSIDLKPFWVKKIRDYLSTEEENYKNKLYAEYLQLTQGCHENFLNDFNKFKYFMPETDEIGNDIEFNVESYLNDKFPINKKNAKQNNASNVYNNNFNKLNAIISKNEFLDFIDENIDLKSMIYFLNVEYEEIIKQRFEKTLSDSEIEARSPVIPDDESTQITLSNSKLKPVAPQENAANHNHGRPHTRSSIEKSDNSKSKNGKDAERVVWKKLKEIYSSLRWTSENSDIPAERNNSSIYDMEYLNNGKKYFVEVKASSKEFFMSFSEFNFAKENTEVYELYFVDINAKRIDGPHKIEELEGSKIATQYKFSYEIDE